MFTIFYRDRFPQFHLYLKLAVKRAVRQAAVSVSFIERL